MTWGPSVSVPANHVVELLEGLTGGVPDLLDQDDVIHPHDLPTRGIFLCILEMKFSQALRWCIMLSNIQIWEKHCKFKDFELFYKTCNTKGKRWIRNDTSLIQAAFFGSLIFARPNVFMLNADTRSMLGSVGDHLARTPEVLLRSPWQQTIPASSRAASGRSCPNMAEYGRLLRLFIQFTNKMGVNCVCRSTLSITIANEILQFHFGFQFLFNNIFLWIS